MIIRHLSIANFRKYLNLRLDFPTGVIGVIGKNGAGKSTLLEVISWALYGSGGLKTTIGQMFPDFVDYKGETRVALTFETNAASYRVERGFKLPNKSTAMFYAENTLVASGTREVTAGVEKITGMDWKAFQTSFYTRQNELNFLGNLQAGDRSKRLEEMLGLEKINTIINNIKGDIRAVEGEKKGHEQLAQREQEYTEGLAVKEAKLETTLLYTSRFEEELGVLKKGLEELTEDFSAAETKRETYTGLKSQLDLKRENSRIYTSRISSLKGEIEAIETERERFGRLGDEVKRLAGLQSDLDGFEKKRLTYEAFIHKKRHLDELTALLEEQKDTGAKLKERFFGLREETRNYDIINNNIKKLAARIDGLQKATSDLRIEQNDSKRQLDKLTNQMKDIEMLGSDAVCSFCLRPFKGEMDTILAHFRAEMDKLEKKEMDSSRRLETETTHLKKTLEQKQEQEKSRGQIEQLREKLYRQEGELKGLAVEVKANMARKEMLEKDLQQYKNLDYDPDEYEKLKAEVSELQKKEKDLARLSERMAARDKLQTEINQLSGEIDIINNNITSLMEEMARLNFSEENYLGQKEKLHGLRETVRKRELELAEGRKSEAVLGSEIAGLKNQLRLVEDARHRVKELIGQKIDLESLIEILKELKTDLAARIRPTLIRYSSDLLELMSDGKFSELDLNENYDISIRDYGELRELGRFSGGEQDLANLSLRLAISKLLATSSNLEAGFLILDEVFGSQDNFRKENILGAIAGLGDFFQQIFIVTHVEDIKEAVQTLITIEENSDGSSMALME
jgi:exonuclease SbcC